MEYNGKIGSTIIARYQRLIEAKQHLQTLVEDGVPANAVSSGNVSPQDGEIPPVPLAGNFKKRKKKPYMLSRQLPMMLDTSTKKKEY